MKKGFTLIETLVAILLLSLMLTGASALIQQALQASSKIKNDTTAVFLSQEAFELVRYQRDTNKLGGNPWMDGLQPGPPCGTANGCIARINSSTGAVTFSACGGGGCPFLMFDPTAKIYNYSGSQTTPYQRTIKIQSVGGPNPEVRVQVTMAWTTIFGSRSYVWEENLLDWQ
ncbi:MAG: Uncharacterized protein G01um101429_640 [Parcubacteria group bacterium Gr01-1014_29]|nr:MAG: Uncharacterized protein G01um101429_640 [Parcubacteria group bacterium Gr01-1014_29]